MPQPCGFCGISSGLCLTFNSLFEMQSDRRSDHEAFLRLSILYLRCGGPLSGGLDTAERRFQFSI